MSRPLLLDLFCGAGGAAVGYHRAGFDVVGVDIKPQPNYPFEFRQGDAMQVTWHQAIQFDAIHASPPCQAYSRLRHLPWLRDRDYPDLLAPTRELLQRSGRPWVIENVMDAPFKWRATICGAALGLPQVSRHRGFEASFLLMGTPCPGHEVLATGSATLGKRYKSGVTGVKEINRASVAGHVTGWREAAVSMGIDWMTRDELTQAIPPAYTQYIGEQLMQVLEGGES